MLRQCLPCTSWDFMYTTKRQIAFTISAYCIPKGEFSNLYIMSSYPAFSQLFLLNDTKGVLKCKMDINHVISWGCDHVTLFPARNSFSSCTTLTSSINYGINETMSQWHLFQQLCMSNDADCFLNLQLGFYHTFCSPSICLKKTLPMNKTSLWKGQLCLSVAFP